MSNWLEKLGGDPGANAFSTVAVAFSQPAVSANVTITVDNTSWIPVGIGAFIAAGGAYTVVSVNSLTSVTIKNSGGTSNAAPSATIPIGSRFAAAGVPGATGVAAGSLTVDVVATTNLALSGTTSIDGQTLTANTTRVLATGQTTASQNGLWLVQSGAWTRPTDFDTDSEVIVSQLVFVKSGTAYAGTNWQLTSGSTLAANKVYAQLASSVTPGVLSADVLLTANDSLSGTATRDGVTLTAGVTRVLAVGQTTPAQNGLWLAQAGAWTRPSDFSADAQVVVGQLVFVKPGGTSIPATGKNYQLTAGSTIAGSKTYQVSASGSSTVAPVDAVATSNTTASGTTAIDGVTLVAGTTRILLTAQTTPAQNGVWLANAGAWTRPTDYSTDAQVAAALGQPLFVKPGGVSVPAEGQTWNMTTGSTIAGSKTFRKFVSTAASALTADFILTSNDALSGTATRDGVALSAGMVGLAVAQTTASQNGRYTVTSSGAWVNLFANDTDVASAIGVPVFVKAGGLSVPSEGVNFTLISGATLAANKVYAKTASSRLAPVRAVQTRTLLTVYADPWVYDNAAGTWTEPYVVGGLAGSPWYVFDGIVPAVGDRLEVSFGSGSLPTTAVSNGVFVVTTLGNGSTKAVLTRAPDFTQALVQSVAGVGYEVNDGLRYKNSRRQLGNTGAVTVGTTALTFAAVERLTPLEIDATQGLYNLKSFTSADISGYGYGAADQSAVLDKICYDYRLGPKVRVRVPAGIIPCSKPFNHYGQVQFVGAGDGVTYIRGYHVGPVCSAQILSSNGSVNGDGYPTTGPAVDSYSTATSLSTETSVIGATNVAYFYNLSEHSLLLDDWTQFECVVELRFRQLGVRDPLSHIVSCRGRRTINDLDDYDTVTSFGGSPFALIVNEQTATKTITAYMRLTDTTAGVYGSTVQNGGGTGTITGDGTITPTEDAPNFTIRIDTGGTAGVAGMYVSWAIDGKRFCKPRALGTTTALVISNETNEFSNLFTAKVNLSGNFTAGTTYKIPCSGVNKTVTLTSSTALAININYIARLQYRSGKMYLYVSPAGGTLDSGASATTGVSVTGVVRQRAWEATILGEPQNSGLFVASSDFHSWQGWFGGIRFKSSSVTAPGSTEITSLYDNRNGVTGNKFCWVPNSDDVVLDAGGVLRKFWRHTIEPNNLPGYIMPRILGGVGVLQFGDGGFEQLTLDAQSDAVSRGTCLASTAWRDHVFSDIGFLGGSCGWSGVGPDFGSVNHNIRWQAKWGPSLKFFQGKLDLTGTQKLSNSLGRAQFILVNCAVEQSGGSFFQNIDQTNQVAMYMSELQTSSFGDWYCDAENLQQNPCARELIRASISDGCSLKLSGNGFTIEAYSTLTQVAGQGCNGDVVFENFSFVSAGVTLSNTVLSNYSQLNALAQSGYSPRPFVIGKGVVGRDPAGFEMPLVSVANTLLVDGIAGTAAITDDNAAIVWSEGISLSCAITANRTKTLGVAGMSTGKKYRLNFVGSAFTLALVNGGPAGGTILTVPASYLGDLTLRLNEAGNLVRA